jgi:3-hydroxyisobutyrate dehydrogenase-like beta-hydroxyacid dehydrogenase
MANVAFLGMGLIGAALAQAALRRGDKLRVWNRTPLKAQALAAHGAIVCASPAEAIAGVERVHLALSDDAAVDGVLDACGEELGRATVIDHTTAAPAGTRARADQLGGRNVPFLHAPVFMSPAMCLEAQGLMFVAGPRAVFDDSEAALGAMTGKVIYLGERPDLAAAYKLFGNGALVALVAGLADVFTMAAELGIAAEQALELFAHFNPAGVLTYRGRNMATGDYRPSFELTMARKDVRLMLEAAGKRPLAVLPGIAARMDELIARGHGGDDMGVLSIDAVASGSLAAELGTVDA